jgi:UDP-N-acetyl-D-galactosamine dehydrogenase
MGSHVARTMIKKMIRRSCAIKGARIGVLGLTFKENCPDLRNTRVTDIIEELKEFGCEVLVHDAYADSQEARKYYGIELQEFDTLKDLDGLIIAVAHDAYKEVGMDGLEAMFRNPEKIIIGDIKGILDQSQTEGHNACIWRL